MSKNYNCKGRMPVFVVKAGAICNCGPRFVGPHVTQSESSKGQFTVATREANAQSMFCDDGWYYELIKNTQMKV